MKIKLTIILFIVFGFTANAQAKKWTLQECVDYALEKNISIKQSELDIETSEINKKDAIGNFLPSLNSRAGHSWSIGLSQDPVTFSAVTATTTNISGGLSSGITIYDGLQNVNQLHRANL